MIYVHGVIFNEAYVFYICIYVTVFPEISRAAGDNSGPAAEHTGAGVGGKKKRVRWSKEYSFRTSKRIKNQ